MGIAGVAGDGGCVVGVSWVCFDDLGVVLLLYMYHGTTDLG